MTATSPLDDLAGAPMRTRRRHPLLHAKLLASSALAALLAGGPAGAQIATWTGSANDDWDNAGNWLPGAVPTVMDAVVVNISNPFPVIGAGVNGVASHVFVGQDAAGGNAIYIVGGGTLTSASTNGNLLGLDVGSNGEILVNGAGSQWTSNGLIVAGVEGRGVVFVTGAGRIDSAGTLLGFAAGSTALVNLSGAGSQWINTGAFGAGLAGSALAVVSSGAYLENTDGVIAAEAGSSGQVNVSGGQWNNTGALLVALGGDGRLNVTSSGIVDSNVAVIGGFVASEGTVTVSGAGSQLNSVSATAIGEQGTGTLIVDNGGAVNTGGAGFVGHQAGSAGTVDINVGTWTVGAQLVVGDAGTGMLTVENGTVSSASSTIGRLSGALGAVTLGSGSSWLNNALTIGEAGSGMLAIEGGSIVQTNFNGTIGMFADGAATLTDASTWNIGGDLRVGFLGTGDLTIGAGSVVNVGGFVSVADQADSFGALLVNGNMAAAGGVTIHQGGWLGGSGMLTGATMVSGTVAPGNSIGTLSIIGNYTQNSGSTYVVEGNAAGQSDLISVTGSATLNGGTVQFVPFPDFTLATPYTILTATGGVTGGFDDATALSVFLAPVLSYDANNAYLTLTAQDFATAAMTPNQIATAGGAQSLGSGNAVYDAILLLGSQQEAQAAFDALSGEAHASIKTALVEDSRFLRDAATSRIRAAFGKAAAGAAPVLAYGPGGPELAAPSTSRFAVWGQGYGSWGEHSSDGNAAAFERGTGGFFLGADAAVADNLRLGLLAGYGHADYSAADRASSGSSDSFHLGLYGGGKVGDLGFRIGGAYSWHDTSTSRTVAFPGFTDTLTARYGAGTTQIFAEAGYEIETATARFEPFAGLAYVHQRTDGFTETGGAAALTSPASSFGTPSSTLGIRAETQFMMGGMSAKAHGSLAWRHAFGPAVPTSGFSFAGGSPFTIAGVPIARNAGVIEVGLDLEIAPSATFGVQYSGQIGKGVQDHGLRGRLAVRF